MADARDLDAGAPPLAWPAFPKSEEEARAIVEGHAKRTPHDAGVPMAADLGARIERAIRRGSAQVGLASIDAFIAKLLDAARAEGHPFFLLWGTHHDASAQVEMFRSLTGPLAKAKWDHVIVEQLRADGRWLGIANEMQLGDSKDLQRWTRTGSNDALESLRAAQERDDYAAWKFGYVSSILGIVADGRTAGHSVEGCDMPLALQSRIDPITRSKYGNALRELHCALALPHTRAVAALWGAQHVGDDGFARFLPSDAKIASVRLIGGRPATAADAVWADVAARYDLVDPLLLPSESEEDSEAAIVILEDPSTATHFERKRLRGEDAGGVALEGNFSFSGASASQIRIDDRELNVLATSTTERLSPGPHVLAAPRGNKRTLIASFVMPQAGWVELRLERTEPEVTITLHVP